MTWLPLFLAPFVGSFLGVLVRRLPAGRPVVMGRSACEGCGRTLPVFDLVPVVSYLVLGGRARCCGARIAPVHLWIELAATGVALWAMGVEADPARLWAGCVLGWTLLTLGWIDAGHLRLPDVLTLPLLLAGLAGTAWLAPDDMTIHTLGAAVGFAAFRAIDLGYRLWRGRSGIGQGDAKLLAAGGAWLGWQALPTVILVAAILGLAAALVRQLSGRPVGRQTALPFGPCLAFAIWLGWLYPAMSAG